MTYKEKLELYSQGKLDEQQRTEIEKELEKQEAFTDYLRKNPDVREVLKNGEPRTGKKRQQAPSAISW